MGEERTQEGIRAWSGPKAYRKGKENLEALFVRQDGRAFWFETRNLDQELLKHSLSR